MAGWASLKPLRRRKPLKLVGRRDLPGRLRRRLIAKAAPAVIAISLLSKPKRIIEHTLKILDAIIISTCAFIDEKVGSIACFIFFLFFRRISDFEVESRLL